MIGLIGRVRCSPIHGALEFFHRFRRQLYLTVASLAIFQMLEIFVIKSESRQVRKLWRSAKLLEFEVARQFTQRVNIRREFEISLGSRMDVHRSKNEYLIRCRGVQNLCHRSSFPNFPDLIVIEADELTKKLGWLGRVVRGLNADTAERK